MLVGDAREIALMIVVLSWLLSWNYPKFPREPIADSFLYSSVQNIRQDGQNLKSVKSPAIRCSQAPPSFLRHFDMPSIQRQQRNEKTGRDKRGKYDEEMAVWWREE
jgi:hypothetical protein